MRTLLPRIAAIVATALVAPLAVGLVPAQATATSNPVQSVHAAVQAAAPTGDIPPPVSGRSRHSKLVRVWVKIGGDVDVKGASVRVINTRGHIVATARTTAGGTAVFTRSELPRRFALHVVGGVTSHGVRNVHRLEVAGQLKTDSVIFISPVTTAASLVSHRKHISYSRALRQVKRNLHIADWVRDEQFSMSKHIFDPRPYERLLASHAPRSAMRGTAYVDALYGAYRYSGKGHTRSKVARAAATSAAGLAASLATASVEAVGFYGTGAILGKMLPANPTSTEILGDLGQISDQLTTISNQLTDIENGIQALETQLSKSQFNSVYGQVSSIVNATTTQWGNYVWQAQHYACPPEDDPSTCAPLPDDYESTVKDTTTGLCGLADISAASLPFANWGSLFTNVGGATGLLDALFQVYVSNQYPYWTQADMTTLAQEVDYYGTLQAQGILMLNDAWSVGAAGGSPCTRPASSVSRDINNYIVQNNYIRANMPSAIAPGSIVLPPTATSTADATTETSLDLFKVTSPPGVVSGSYGNNAMATCTSGTATTTSNFNTYFWQTQQIPASTFASTWQAAVPSGWSIVHANQLGSFKSPLLGKRGGNTGLWTLANGNGSPWALVTAESVALGTTEKPSYGWTGLNEGPMWCNSTTLSLSNGNANSWVTNFGMYPDNNGNHINYPQTPASLGTYLTIPAGVLATQPVKAHYVAPYTGAPGPPASTCDPTSQDCVADTTGDATPVPGSFTCNNSWLVTCSMPVVGTEMINSYNDRDMWRLAPIPAGALAWFAVTEGTSTNVCDYCGATVYDSTGAVVVDCSTPATCVDPYGDQLDLSQVVFMATTTNPYYVEIYRTGSLPVPLQAYSLAVTYMPA